MKRLVEGQSAVLVPSRVKGFPKPHDHENRRERAGHLEFVQRDHCLLPQLPRQTGDAATTFAHTREQLHGETRRRIAAAREADRETRALWHTEEIRGAVRGYLDALAAR